MGSFVREIVGKRHQLLVLEESPDIMSTLNGVHSGDFVFFLGSKYLQEEDELFFFYQRGGHAAAVTARIPESEVIFKGGQPDPHVWMDLKAWSSAAGQVAEVLGEWDPVHAHEYRLNAQAVRKAYLDADERVRKMMLPVRKKRIWSESGLAYFARAYGLVLTREPKDAQALFPVDRGGRPTVVKGQVLGPRLYVENMVSYPRLLDMVVADAEKIRRALQ